MRPRPLIRLALILAALVCLSSPASLRADVLKLVIDSTIHPITNEYLGRALAEAERTHAEAVLIELSTPGGLLDSTRNIIQKIVASRTPVIIFVTPSGSRAASAGFFILESADVAAMSPGTNTGAAHPVSAGGQMDKVMSMKIENDSAALLRSVVSKRGRNVEVAESAVRESRSFTEQEALKLNLIDLVAADQAALFQQLEGRMVHRFNGDQVRLHLVGVPVREFNETLKQNILGYLMDPNVSFILLAIGMLALYSEFNHPGAVIPGVVGLIFILLAVFALNLLPTRFAALALIVAAFVLFALEAKFATHGILTLGGIVSMVIGALLLVDSPVPEMRVRLLTALAVSIPMGLITVFLLTIALRARRRKVVTGVQGLIGESGVVRTPLAPQGRVFVHGELWNAVCPAPLLPGDAIVVRAVDGLTLQVEALPAAQQTASELPARS